MKGFADPPQFESEQGPQGTACRYHAAFWQSPCDIIDVQSDEIMGKQEEAAETGAEALAREIELTLVGDRCFKCGDDLCAAASFQSWKAGIP